MAKNLVIVESPAKAKTISRFLGKEYKVLASMGHVRDLPKSQIGIEVDKDFKPSYEVSADKKKVITQLKGELDRAEHLWIATDEDREGEAIGWHLLSALKADPKKTPIHRIVFHEITETAIKHAIDSPREIDQNVVDAQQARRILDRLVGYELSPLLWKKVRYGLSAGRVQSVAVRLVVDREREIEAFKPEEFWKITGLFEKQDKAMDKEKRGFSAELQRKDGKKIKVESETETKDILSAIEGKKYEVSKVEKKQVKKSPAAPFITSTLQQEASRKLNFSVKKTMMVAQQLYEGINMGAGETGLITYMRTDSVNLADSALKTMQEFIKKQYGAEYALDTPRKYKGRKSAQEAHEAIRPVNVELTPEAAATYLNNDQSRLYELIWKRTIACQMKEAILNKVAVDVAAGDSGYEFRATGQTVQFPGFMEVYMEGKDEEKEGDEEQEEGKEKGEKFLPQLEEGEAVDMEKIDPTQHFTKPPARYTEASLVKKMESEGIGRPSTYAPTISTIMTRGYIEKEAKALKPTDLAMVVTDMLVEHFSNIVNYQFTAEMEEKLDLVEEGKQEWVPMIREFYGPFHANIEDKNVTLKKEDVVNQASDEICEKCGEAMVIKLGRFGKFLSCSGYPECKNAKPLEGEDGPQQQEETPEVKALKEKFKDKKCDKCEDGMLEVKVGRFGPFLGCNKYPDCKNMQPVVIFSGVKCPNCEVGQLVERRTRKGGRIFWGCNKFPKCKTATWNKPVSINKEGKLMVEDKEGNVVLHEAAKAVAKGASKAKAAGKAKAVKKPAKKG